MSDDELRERSRFWVRTQTMYEGPLDRVGGHPVWLVHQSELAYLLADELSGAPGDGLQQALVRFRLYDERALKDRCDARVPQPVCLAHQRSISPSPVPPFPDVPVSL